MKENKPLVSIITPIFNRAQIVHNTLESVINQSYKNWELLLIDDGSTDSIEQFLYDNYSTEKRIRFYKRDREPKSASTCRNIGIEKAKGDLIIFLDSDDLIKPFCLEHRVEIMNHEVNLDFAVFRFQYKNIDGILIENNFINRKDPLINFLSEKSYWNITCPIWKKSFLLKINGFNENFQRYQDIEMHIRAITQENVNYRIISEMEPDIIILPSQKDQICVFSSNIFASIQQLIPQTNNCLININKMHYLQYMENYLKKWLLLLSYSHFDKIVCSQTKDVFKLFKEYKIVSNMKILYYKMGFYSIKFLTIALMKIYNKMIN